MFSRLLNRKSQKFQFLVVLAAVVSVSVSPGCSEKSILPDIQSPFVVSSNPSGGETDIPIESHIIVTFSEPIDANSITSESFYLNNSIDGVYSVSSYTISLVPHTTLSNATTYTVSLTAEIQDLNGNKLIRDTSWTFTTTR